jgi:hypothetical protein
MLFLGDRLSGVRLKSKQRIVNMSTTDDVEWDIEPPPKLVALRDDLGIDYGKFDYVMIHGRPLLLDINKTIGKPTISRDNENEMVASFKYHSEGLYHYFREQIVK